MKVIELHKYVREVVGHMPGWAYLEADNYFFPGRELRPSPTIRYGETSARIYFDSDDRLKKTSAGAITYRQVNGRTEFLPKTFAAKAGFSDGRSAEAVARDVLRKLAPAALVAGAELDRLEAQAHESRATMLATVEKLNASKLLSKPIGALREQDKGAHFYTKGIHGGYVNEYGAVRLERLEVSAETAIRILAILEEGASQ